MCTPNQFDFLLQLFLPHIPFHTLKSKWLSCTHRFFLNQYYERAYVNFIKKRKNMKKYRLVAYKTWYVRQCIHHVRAIAPVAAASTGKLPNSIYDYDYDYVISKSEKLEIRWINFSFPKYLAAVPFSLVIFPSFMPFINSSTISTHFPFFINGTPKEQLIEI